MMESQQFLQTVPPQQGQQQTGIKVNQSTVVVVVVVVGGGGGGTV